MYNGAVPTKRETAPVMHILLSDTQLRDAGTVTLNVLIHKVIKQTAALADHLQKSETTVVVLLVNLEVLCELVDALCKDCNLNLRRTCVGSMGAVALDNCCLLVFCDHSMIPFHFLTYPQAE